MDVLLYYTYEGGGRMILKSTRINRGLSTNEACKHLKIVRGTLSRYENLDRFPNNKILKRFKRVYNLSDEQIGEMFLEYFYTSM